MVGALLLLLAGLPLVAAQQASPLFTISIDIGGDAPEELAVRDGDVPSRIADEFAQKHGLNDRGACGRAAADRAAPVARRACRSPLSRS